MGLISVLIGVLVIVVVGAICFWAIDKFATDRRLAQRSNPARSRSSAARHSVASAQFYSGWRRPNIQRLHSQSVRRDYAICPSPHARRRSS
jgi:hypothetical protein